MSLQELQQLISPKFTPETLYTIIEKETGLTNIEVKKITILDASSKKGDSYLSNLVRFTVDATGTNNGGVEQSTFLPIIVKILPPNIGRRTTFRSTDFFEDEFIFYNKVWPALLDFQKSKNVQEIIKIPRLLSSWCDGVNDYIALSDLSYDGYKSAERGKGLDYDHTIAILTLLAGFNGIALAFKDQNPELFEKVAGSLKETYWHERLRDWFAKFMKSFCAVVRDAVEKELPQKYLQRLDVVLKSDLYATGVQACKTRGPCALISHGDAWAPNFLLKYDDGKKPVDVALIDFQLTRYTTVSNDLLFFLMCCIDPELVETKWDHLIEFYYQELIKTAEKLGSQRKNLFSLQDLNDDIKTNAGLGFAILMEGLSMSLLDEDQVGDLDAIKGNEAVPLETVWAIRPYKEQEKRQRIAAMVKFAVDRDFI